MQSNLFYAIDLFDRGRRRSRGVFAGVLVFNHPPYLFNGLSLILPPEHVQCGKHSQVSAGAMPVELDFVTVPRFYETVEVARMAIGIATAVTGDLGKVVG